MCTLAGRRHAKIVAALLNANDVAPLGSISTWDVALRPGAAVPHAYGHAGTSITGLHLRRFVPDAVPASFALPDSSSCQTHHLSLLHPRATLCRTSLGPVGEVPVGYAWPHVALLAPLWPNPGTALLVIDDAALLSDAANVPRPSAQSAVHRALAPVRADLPVRAQPELTALCGLWGGQVGTALGVNHGGPVPKALPALELPLLQPRATGHAALGP